MTDIIADHRGEYIAGLRALADTLESTPTMPCADSERILLPLGANSAVEEVATTHGLSVQYTEHGNAYTDLVFGPITYHVYGYVDFTAHVAQQDEKHARTWAKRHGMEIQPVEQPTTQFKAVPLNEVQFCGSQCPEHMEHKCQRSPGHQPGICRDEKQKGTESCTWDPARSVVIA
ncbi:hypothetical protein ACOKM5_23250 [Streptomyces sp. BH097]|uniref:hypothetical protein n=1 Tax=unclassified Streptomyces TaxID=2593676 RepID=UPI003BB60D78